MAHKDKIKHEMGQHQHPRDRFKAFVTGVIDQAVEMANAGKTAHEILVAGEGLKTQLDEAWDDIEGKGAGHGKSS